MALSTTSSLSADQLAMPLFGVFLSQGSYRKDELHRTLFVTHDEKAANEYVACQEALHASMRVKIEQSYKDHESWTALNPRPTATMPERALLPDWTDVKVITNKMRAERRRLKAEYAQLVDKANEPLSEWFTKSSAKLQALKDASLTPTEKIAYQGDNCNSYRVDTLTWMPPVESILPKEGIA